MTVNATSLQAKNILDLTKYTENCFTYSGFAPSLKGIWCFKQSYFSNRTIVILPEIDIEIYHSMRRN